MDASNKASKVYKTTLYLHLLYKLCTASPVAISAATFRNTINYKVFKTHVALHCYKNERDFKIYNYTETASDLPT